MAQWEQEKVSDQSALVDRVVNVYGIDRTSDTEMAGVALDLLDETVKEMNSHLYEFNKMVESNLTITADANTIVLRNGVYRESIARMIYTPDSTQELLLMYLPYVQYQDAYGSSRYIGSGIPVVYSFRNVERDGTLYLGPTPDSGAATDYTLTVEYYRRIPLVSSVTAALDIPPEVEPALVYGAQKRLAIHLYGPGHPDVAAFQGLEMRALQQLKAVDKRHPDTNKRFKLADRRFAGKRNPLRGQLFIRIR